MSDTPETPSIDDLVAQRIAGALQNLTAAQVDLAAAQVDALGRIEELERTVAGLGGPVRPGDGIPPFLRQIPSDRLIFEIDPYRPDTYNHKRPFGQAWAGGRMYQRGDRTEWVHRQIPPQHRAGYAVEMDENGNVDAWPMEDGTRRRYGAIEIDGARFFRLATQSRPHLDGYDPAAMQWFSGGQPRPVGQGWRIDTGIDRRHGHSDPRTFDASRSELSGTGANIKTGRGTPVTIWGIAYRGHRWMQTSASIGGPFDLHAPGWSTTGQMVASISGGRLLFWSKSSPSTNQVIWGETTNHDLTNVGLFDMPAPEPGEVHQIVVASRPDRAGGTSLFDIYQGNGHGDIEHLGGTRQPHGYQWDQAAKNGENYPKTQVYPWGEWNTADSRRYREMGLPLFNHDQRHGNVYDLSLAAFAVTDEATLGEDVDAGVRMMGAHVAATVAGRG